MKKLIYMSDEIEKKIKDFEMNNPAIKINFSKLCSDSIEKFLSRNGIEEPDESLFGVLEFKDKSLEQKMKEEIKLIKSNPDMWDYLNAEIASYTSNIIFEAYTTLNLRDKPKIPDKDGDIQVAFEELSEEQKAEFIKIDPTCRRTSILNFKVK